MSFASGTYLIFLPAVTAVYWLCPGKYRYILLLLASCLFYMGWSVPLTLLLLAVSLISWGACLLLERRKNPVLMGLLLAVIFLPLLLFKYARFFASGSSALFGWPGSGTLNALSRLVLPVGISFYTFQAVSCVIDVYRGGRSAERNFLKFALFVSFFPQLVAGPIERADDLMPQLTAVRAFQKADLRAGAKLLLCGFFRKICVADFIAPYVDRLFSLKTPDGFAALLGAVLFGVQIYNDFAGYSEIAMGSARLLGIRLTRNFREPYLAADLRDFWRRWHITLDRWFRSYVYIPLGGRHRRFLASGAVFLLSGLWHGADWTYVCWGIYHGLLYGLATLMPQKRLPKWAGTALTFTMVTLGWIFFRAADIAEAFSLYGSLFSPWHFSAVWREAGMSLPVLIHLAVVVGASFLTCRWAFTDRDGSTDRDRALYVLLVLSIALCWLGDLQSGAANAFIYFQF